MSIQTIPQTNSFNRVAQISGHDTVPVYKLRGRFEFIHDSVQILKRLRGTGEVIVNPTDFSITISFMCDWNIVEEVVEDLWTCKQDLHVFVESLKFVEDYDGERNGMFDGMFSTNR